MHNMQQGVANNEYRLSKFNKYPKYKSQLLAKTCPRCSTTSWNKERWIKLKEQAKQHSMHLFLIFSPKNLQDQQESRFLIFSTIFLYFLRTDVTQAPTTKFCTLNRGGMWPTENQEHFLKIGKQVRAPKLPLSDFFFKILRSVPNGEAISWHVQNFIFFLL